MTESQVPSSQEYDSAKNRILSLLNPSRPPVVIALKGGWGEGKTFFWKRFLAPAIVPPPGYISVFGAQSLLHIKERILASAIPATVGLDNAAWWDRASDLISRSLRSLLQGFRLPDALIVELALPKLLRAGWILCIDDVERLPESVTIDALLGLITDLRDTYQMKLVLIYNDAAISSDTFRKYQEKVIDREIPFAADFPAILKHITAAAPHISDTPERLHDLSRRCACLDLRNIRVIVRSLNYFDELLADLPDDANAEFLRSAFYSILLYSWVKFSRPDGITLELVANHSPVFLRDRNERAETPESQLRSRLNQILDSYGYSYTDDTDRLLLQFIQSDTLSSSELLREYNAYLERKQKSDLENQFQKVWQDLYSCTFRDNSDEFCSALTSSVENYLQWIPVRSFDDVLATLTTLGFSSAADSLLARFVEVRQETIRSFNREPRMYSLKHAALKKVFVDRQQAGDLDQRSLGVVLDSCLEDSFLSSRDRSRLVGFSADELLEYFANTDSDHAVKKLLVLATCASRIANPDSSLTTIQANALAAARKLAELSTINRLRLQSLPLSEATD